MRVLVIGAGIAGLEVARRLSTSEHEVTVVEARDRIGGRLRSVEGLDLGATWCWANEPRVNSLIDHFGIATHQQHIAGNAVYDDPNGTVVLDGNPIDAPARRFSEGAESLASAVAASLDNDQIRYTTKVTSVATNDDGTLYVTAEAADGTAHTAEADHVVIALPPALAVEQIQFDPPFPDRLAGLARSTPVWMGAMVKVVIRYAIPFWREAGLAGSAMSHVGPLREIHDMSGPYGQPAALFGFAHSADSSTCNGAEVLNQLVRLFGPLASEAQEICVQDWRTEAFTSPAAVERLTAYQTFGHALYQEASLGGRLHWSSTETSTQFPGHIEGALEAAERTARAILTSPTSDIPTRKSGSTT